MSTWIEALVNRIDGRSAVTPESIEPVLWLTNLIRSNNGERELTLSEAVEQARAFRKPPSTASS